MQVTPAIKRTRRIKRHARVRAKVIGTSKCPRLAVYRSLSAIHAQLIDDGKGKTLVSLITKKLAGDAGERKGKIADSYLGGKALAEAAIAKKIKQVVFDRGGFRYHGRVQAFAEGARAGGLKF